MTPLSVALLVLALAILGALGLAAFIGRPRRGPSVCPDDLASDPERRLRRWQE